MFKLLLILLSLLVWQEGDGRWVSAKIELDTGDKGKPSVAHVFVDRKKGQEAIRIETSDAVMLCLFASRELVEIDLKQKTCKRSPLPFAPEQPGARVYLPVLLKRITGAEKLPDPEAKLLTLGKHQYQRIIAGGAKLELLRSTGQPPHVRKMSFSARDRKVTYTVTDVQSTKIVNSTFEVPPGFKEIRGPATPPKK